jgi:hypothetical protein
MLYGEIESKGDLDLFFFEGAAGTRATIQVGVVGASGPLAAVEVYRPDGSLFDADHGLPSPATLDLDLDQDGIYTILVSEYLSTTTMQYSVSYECLGDCPCYKDFFGYFVKAYIAGTIEGTGTGGEAEYRLLVMGYLLAYADWYADSGRTLDALRLLAIAYAASDGAPTPLPDAVTGEAVAGLNDRLYAAALDLLDDLGLPSP